MATKGNLYQLIDLRLHVLYGPEYGLHNFLVDSVILTQPCRNVAEALTRVTGTDVSYATVNNWMRTIRNELAH